MRYSATTHSEGERLTIIHGNMTCSCACLTQCPAVPPLFSCYVFLSSSVLLVMKPKAPCTEDKHLPDHRVTSVTNFFFLLHTLRNGSFIVTIHLTMLYTLKKKRNWKLNSFVWRMYVCMASLLHFESLAPLILHFGPSLNYKIQVTGTQAMIVSQMAKMAPDRWASSAFVTRPQGTEQNMRRPYHAIHSVMQFKTYILSVSGFPM